MQICANIFANATITSAASKRFMHDTSSVIHSRVPITAPAAGSAENAATHSVAGTIVCASFSCCTITRFITSSAFSSMHFSASAAPFTDSFSRLANAPKHALSTAVHDTKSSMRCTISGSRSSSASAASVPSVVAHTYFTSWQHASVMSAFLPNRLNEDTHSVITSASIMRCA